MPAGPDFLCIGMGKAGTGWLYDTMLRHPGVWMPPIKEIHYLDRPVPRLGAAKRRAKKPRERAVAKREERGKRKLYDRDFDFIEAAGALAGKPLNYTAYADLFRAKGDQLSGDVTPGYGAMAEDLVVGAMGAFPQLKIILLIRDPVARAWSHFSMKNRREIAPTEDYLNPVTLREMLDTPKSSATQSPSGIAKTWRRHVPEDQLRIFFFDDIQAEPDRIARESVSFLGLDPDKLTETPGNRKAELAKLEMTPEVRAVLVDVFSDELRECARYFGGHAALWAKKYGVG